MDSQRVFVKIKFENKHRQHEIKLAKLIHDYKKLDGRFGSVGVFLLSFFRIKHLVGARSKDKKGKKTGGGYLSSMAYLLILISHF